MDMRKLRCADYDGERLTVRLRHTERQQLRHIAAHQGTTESALVREAISVLVEVLGDADAPKPRPNPFLALRELR